MEHVVTKPSPPFFSSDGRLEVHQVPAWHDNLVWIAVCTETKEAAVVDGPEASAVIAYCHRMGITLTTIFNTHTHTDHIGINRDLETRGILRTLRVFGPSKKAVEVPGLTVGVDEGDSAKLGALSARVMLTEGHIDGHVSYVIDDVVFCGDTMFGAGCGYLFDGPPAKMFSSLTRLAALDGRTRVCCAHEYTEDNLRFAWSVEPDNETLRERIRRVWALRREGRSSVPSTIAEERATNPFLRGESDTLRANVSKAWPGRDLSTPEAMFAATRALKDRKEYRAIAESDLPIG